MPDERRIALTLSGGGFRATLFHLGVVRFLYDAGILGRIQRIAAVSGGSVLAAHLVLHWDRYTGDSKSFDAAAQEIVHFVRSDVRGRVVRRWILAWLLVLPRLLKWNHWTFSNLLQRQYQRLYGNARLGDLNTTLEKPRPQVFFNCASLSTGSPCSFGRSGFMWYEGDVERPITAPETRIAFAVAASSAFPPLFPPVAVSHKILSCDRRDFPNPLYLTDGGVYDNLGIDRLIWHQKLSNDTDLFLMSDAEGNFDWNLDAKFKFIVARNVRASDLLMKRVSDLEYESLSAAKNTVAFKIGLECALQDPPDPSALSPGIQRSLRNVRTDLDAFSPNEIVCLLRHGYTVAREISIANGLAQRDAPSFPWKTVPGLKETSPNLEQIGRSGTRKVRLWAFGDWASWASLAAIVLLCTVAAAPVYLGRRQLTQENQKLRSVNRKLNDVAIDYFKQRHRPVQPGISASAFVTDVLSASTVCCIVQSRGGGKRLLLGSFSAAAPHVGDAILQPGQLDGGSNPSDLVGRLFGFIPLKKDVMNSALGEVAELAPGVQATNAVAGFGAIRGIVENLAIDQKVFIVGRTTGVANGVVTSIDTDVTVQFENGPFMFGGMIILAGAAGPLSTGGDGGAPVLTTDGKLAAMVVAGSSTHTIAVPIRRVFDALDVELAK